MSLAEIIPQGRQWIPHACFSCVGASNDWYLFILCLAGPHCKCSRLPAKTVFSRVMYRHPRTFTRAAHVHRRSRMITWQEWQLLLRQHSGHVPVGQLSTWGCQFFATLAVSTLRIRSLKTNKKGGHSDKVGELQWGLVLKNNHSPPPPRCYAVKRQDTWASGGVWLSVACSLPTTTPQDFRLCRGSHTCSGMGHLPWREVFTIVELDRGGGRNTDFSDSPPPFSVAALCGALPLFQAAFGS